MDNKSVFAQRLREARNKKKMTQAELAERVKASPATISAYEHEDSQKGKNPSLSNAQDIALALGVSLDWLCGIENKIEAGATDTLSLRAWLQYLLILLESDPYKCSVDLDREKYEGVLGFTTTIEVENEGVYEFFEAFKKLRQLVNNGSINAELYNSCINGVIDKYSCYFESADN